MYEQCASQNIFATGGYALAVALRATAVRRVQKLGGESKVTPDFGKYA